MWKRWKGFRINTKNRPSSLLFRNENYITNRSILAAAFSLFPNHRRPAGMYPLSNK
jgi:hypothetical protein